MKSQLMPLIVGQITQQVNRLKEQIAKSVIPASLLAAERRTDLLVYIAQHELQWRSYPIPNDPNAFFHHEFLWKDGQMIFEVYCRRIHDSFDIGSNPPISF